MHCFCFSVSEEKICQKAIFFKEASKSRHALIPRHLVVFSAPLLINLASLNWKADP